MQLVCVLCHEPAGERPANSVDHCASAATVPAVIRLVAMSVQLVAIHSFTLFASFAGGTARRSNHPHEQREKKKEEKKTKVGDPDEHDAPASKLFKPKYHINQWSASHTNKHTRVKLDWLPIDVIRMVSTLLVGLMQRQTFLNDRDRTRLDSNLSLIFWQRRRSTSRHHNAQPSTRAHKQATTHTHTHINDLISWIDTASDRTTNNSSSSSRPSNPIAAQQQLPPLSV